jgi:hypothetical protein
MSMRILEYQVRFLTPDPGLPWHAEQTRLVAQERDHDGETFSIRTSKD